MNERPQNNIIDQIDKYKYGLFVMTIIFVLSLLIRVQYGFVERPDINKLLHRKTDDIIELKLETIEETEQRMSFENNDIRNITRNENSEESNGNGSQYDYSNQSIYSGKSLKDVEQSIYALEQTFFDQAGGAQTRASIQQEIEQRKQQQKDTETQRNTTFSANIKSAGNSTKGNVLVSYSVKNRTGQYVPAPGYMCPQGTSGKVVVKIKVDPNGKVVDAKTNSNNSANDCMISYALEFARKSKFNYISETETQEGTITYTFVD